ncbi:unnamed protein product [Oncorhynchus mykiss]|uniref:[histone H3]-lysine(4) N-trimethyltransferase n=1 Tax=Oncorhynchus mykiss TaxID=8022 RepID=A0A060ZA33_ONCMY|nr:unnamed protein product [Oncorhynchus mykiss]
MLTPHLSPFLVALVNHSCCPNVIVTYKGNVAEVRAVQDMTPGEEVFTSYIDLLYPTADRNERLRDAYYFTCDCKECKTKSKDKLKLKVRKRNKPPGPEEISSMMRYARNTIKEFRSAKQIAEKHQKNILCGPSLHVASQSGLKWTSLEMQISVLYYRF